MEEGKWVGDFIDLHHHIYRAHRQISEIGINFDDKWISQRVRSMDMKQSATQFTRILIAFLLIFISISSDAKVIGDISDDYKYQPYKSDKEYYGLLNVMIYTKTTAPSYTLYGSPNVQININDLKIATVEGKSGFLSGSISYLQLPLPNGNYAISIHTTNAWGGNVKNMVDFEVVIKKEQSLSVMVYREGDADYDISARPLGYPTKLGDYTVTPKATIFNEAYITLQNGSLSSAAEFAQKATIEKLKAEEEIKLRLTRAREANEKKEKIAKELRESERIKVEAKIALENDRIANETMKENDRKRKDAEKLAKDDDETCKSYGAKVGTQPYITCRIALNNTRNENIERERNRQQLETRFNELQKQIADSNYERTVESARREEEQRKESAVIQRQLAEDKMQRDRSESSARSQRAFETAAKLLEPTQGVTPSQSPFQTLIIPGRAINCNTVGNITNCR